MSTNTTRNEHLQLHKYYTASINTLIK